MHFSLEQLTDVAVSAVPTLAILGFFAYLTLGGGLSEIINIIVKGWLFG